jgi:hypothetical protein
MGSVTNDRCRAANSSQLAYANEKLPRPEAPATLATTTPTAKFDPDENP